MRTVFTALRHAISGEKNTVLVTILSHTGSAPRGAGSQMLVGKHGLMAGTVGGGAV
ncbi:MAG: XdhC family protein, partial [Oscillospiraceae bacterium]|nr:XdhC family protein [Oscillospiraceae bacterium]